MNEEQKVQELLKPRWAQISKSNYSVSEDGKVRNDISGRVLKPYPNNRSYLYVELQINKEQKRFYVHQLVARHFVAGYEPGLVVNHIDGNKQNNHYTNLQWTTIKDNCIHAHKNGLGKNGINHYNAKLMANDPFQIKHLKGLGMSNRQISYLYGVAETLIHNIVHDKSYKNDQTEPTLLTRRFRLSINFPNSGLKLGDIIYADNDTALLARMLLFEKLFTEISWWEERNASEMPEYVKDEVTGKLFKIEYIPGSHTPSDVKTWNDQEKPFWNILQDLTPATAADYHAYISSPELK